MANEEFQNSLEKKYTLGFSQEIESDTFPIGLNEEIIEMISQKKNEPEWLLQWRLQAYRHWLTLKVPKWARVHYPEIDYQSISYYSAPKAVDPDKPIDPELLAYYEKLGVPMKEVDVLTGRVAVDAVLDSVSIGTTFKDTLAKEGIIFCSFSEAVQEHPELVKQYLGTVVHYRDNYYAALNSAVFSDGSFCFIPKGVKCPMDLSTYFRINQAETGQFERTLIIAEEGASVTYLEGCSAAQRSENQLHAAVVELIALDNASIDYSTVQNWYPGDENGKGGVYNFVTKRGECRGVKSHISWTQVETGSAITWKYPSLILKGDNSNGEFYSIALTNHKQQADTGTKIFHIGKDTKSTIVSKSISAGDSVSTYRGIVKMSPRSGNARNFTECDSLIFGNAQVYTEPHIESTNWKAVTEHEATISKISDEHIFYLQQRGLSEEQAKNLLVNGFCKSVFKKLPAEFSVEAQNLLEINLEGSLG